MSSHPGTLKNELILGTQACQHPSRKSTGDWQVSVTSARSTHCVSDSELGLWAMIQTIWVSTKWSQKSLETVPFSPQKATFSLVLRNIKLEYQKLQRKLVSASLNVSFVIYGIRIWVSWPLESLPRWVLWVWVSTEADVEKPEGRGVVSTLRFPNVEHMVNPHVFTPWQRCKADGPFSAFLSSTPWQFFILPEPPEILLPKHTRA